MGRKYYAVVEEVRKTSFNLDESEIRNDEDEFVAANRLAQFEFISNDEDVECYVDVYPLDDGVE